MNLSLHELHILELEEGLLEKAATNSIHCSFLFNILDFLPQPNLDIFL